MDILQRRHPILKETTIGLGTWSWGDRYFWGFEHGYDEEDIKEVFNYCVDNNVHFFDTAEVYGQGKAESFLGKFIKETKSSISIASKFMPFPWRLKKTDLMKALKKSLNRLGLESLDLYQMHMPLPPITIETWMEAMVDAYQEGLISAIGVSNYDRNQMQRASDILVKEGAYLASNQVEYNLLNRKIEKNGLLKNCLMSGITIIAYSPLALGVLTGKYTPMNPLQGIRGRKYSRDYLEKIQPLLLLMKRIGMAHAGKTTAQVAINWVICKGALPIPGAKNIDQIEQNLGATGWRLTDDEIEQLDDISDNINQERY